MARGLLGRAGIYLVGNLSGKVLQSLLLPVYAFAVSSESLGSYDFALTLANIVAVVVFAAVWESVLRFGLGEGAGRDQNAILATAAKFALLVTLAAAVVIGGLWLAMPDYRDYLVWVGAMGVSYGLALVWQYSARALRLTNAYVVSGVLSAAVAFLMTICLVVWVRLGVDGLVASYVASQLAIVLVLERRVGLVSMMIGRSMDWMLLRRLLNFSVPLILNLVSMFLLVGFGRILITLSLGAEANGQYAFALKITALVSALGTVFSLASIEDAVARVGSVDVGRYMESIVNSLWLAVLGAGGGCLVGVKLLFPLIADTEYGEGFRLVPPLLLYACLHIMATNLGNVFQVADRTRFAASTTIGGLVCGALSSIVLVRPLGAFGVAIGLALGMMVVVVLRWLVGVRLLEFRPRVGRPLVLALVFVLLSAVLIAEPVGDGWPNLIILVVGGLGSGLVLLSGLRGLQAAGGSGGAVPAS
ncbi:MAG: polysaccharide biosynthesis C-terminal domain-containing protein [Arachnia sp.]